MTAGRKVNTQSQSWCTPPKYVNAIREFWNNVIDLDPCSNDFSIVHATVEYKLPETDGLEASWNYPHIFVNPPYGSDRERGTTIKNWLSKCALANSEYGSEVLALVPVAPNTMHWRKCVFGKASAICFLYDTRLRFLEEGVDKGKGAPMACCMICWGNRTFDFHKTFIKFGAVVNITNLKEQRIGTETLTVDLFSPQLKVSQG